MCEDWVMLFFKFYPQKGIFFSIAQKTVKMYSQIGYFKQIVLFWKNWSTKDMFLKYNWSLKGNSFKNN